MQTIMEPQAVRQFARELAEQAHALRAINRATHQAAVEVRARWDDPKYQAYYELLDRTAEHLELFARHTERYGEYLNTKAGLVERYLDRGAH